MTVVIILNAKRRAQHGKIARTRVPGLHYHFIGFDRILRLALGREKNLHLYGPRDFFKNVAGKLAGYSWNLVENYKYRLRLLLTEIHDDVLLTREYLCQNGFLPTGLIEKQPFRDIVVDAPGFKVCAAILPTRPCHRPTSRP